MKPSHDQIAQRAFEIYTRQGCPPDRADAHWRQAEAELVTETRLADLAPNGEHVPAPVTTGAGDRQRPVRSQHRKRSQPLGAV